MNRKSLPSRLWLVRAGVLLVAVFLVAGLTYMALRTQPVWLQGQIEVTTVRAAAKIPGRVLSVDVRAGDSVTAGQLLATLDTAEVDAKAGQAQAAVDAAQAQSDKARMGARDEQVRSAQAQFEAARQQARLAASTHERIARLADEGVLPTQKRDEAAVQSEGAQAQLEGARQTLAMAREATRPEDQRAADAQLAGALAGRGEVQVAQNEARVLAPLAGEIATRVVEPGEMVAAGAPLLVIADLDDMWLTLNLREDLLSGVRMGGVLQGRIPALDDREVTFEVSYIAALADFATWRSTRDLGGFDLRTFEVQARPREPVEGLRPGMSVLIAESALTGRR